MLQKLHSSVLEKRHRKIMRCLPELFMIIKVLFLDSWRELGTSQSFLSWQPKCHMTHTSTTNSFHFEFISDFSFKSRLMKCKSLQLNNLKLEQTTALTQCYNE